MRTEEATCRSTSPTTTGCWTRTGVVANDAAHGWLIKSLLILFFKKNIFFFSFVHVSHGIFFFYLLRPFPEKALSVVMVEKLWKEAGENDVHQSVADPPRGVRDVDSQVNVFGDLLSCGLGYALSQHLVDLVSKHCGRFIGTKC